MKLEVGAGKNPKDGYEHLDLYPGKHIEYVCSSWNTSIEDNTVTEIYARHFFEHLDKDEAIKTIIEWKRILSKNGVINLIVPNIIYHAQQLLMPGKSKFVNISNFEHGLAGFYGWSAGGMQHKMGYTKETLRQLFESFGFVVHFNTCRECDIDITLSIKDT